jgi:hypothetical protein
MSGIVIPIAARKNAIATDSRAIAKWPLPQTNFMNVLGLTRKANKKPSVPKSAGGVSGLPRISTCSLAVFYVEQVALNRHVSPQQAASLLMTGKAPVVNTVSKAQHSMTTICQVVASKKERKLSQQTSKATPAIGPVCFPEHCLLRRTCASSQCYTQGDTVLFARGVGRRREYRSSRNG